jgi:tetratricopeptide (TPR) repeat protein
MADRPVHQSGEQDAEAARLHEEAKRHYERGEYADARSLFERALALQRATLGDDDLATAETLTELAVVLAQQGDPASAQPMLEHTLAIRQRVLGPDHPDTAEAINNLGFVRRMQGDNEAARRLYEQALVIRERTLGPEHPKTATSLSNLGVLESAQRDYAAACSYHERALDIYERAVGPDDLQTGRALNNLASALMDLGNQEAALPLLTRSLAIHERVLGPKHPSLANVLHNLAGLYVRRREYAAARPLYERALIIRERALGAAHPRTAESVGSLLTEVTRMRDFAQGIPLNRIAQALRRSPGNPDAKTIEDLHQLVDRLEQQANKPPLSPASQQALAEAVELQQRAEALFAEQDYAGSQAALERALALREGALGPDDFEQVALLRKLAAALQAQGEYERLRPLQERILEVHVHALGDSHPMTLRARMELTSMRIEEEGMAAALPALEQVHAGLLKQVGSDHRMASAIQGTTGMLERLKALLQEQATARAQQPAQQVPPDAAAPPLDDDAALQVLAGLDEVPWRTLQHAYGPATDVPGQLRALLSPDEHVRERAMHHLCGNIWHQGSVYKATAYAVPFLITLLAYARTPDKPAILQLLAALAEDDGARTYGEDSEAKAAHDAVGAGLPLYLDLLAARNESELQAGAITVLAAFPERSAESAPPLQASLAAEQDRLTRVSLLWALGRVMDASAESRAYFEATLTHTDDPLLAFLAAAALADRAGEATPEHAVDMLVEAAAAVDADGDEGEAVWGVPDLDETLADLVTFNWEGTLELAVARLCKLGSERAIPALLRALRRTHTRDAARTVADALLDLTFNDGRLQPKGMRISRHPDGREKINYFEPARQPARSAATLSADQRALLEALAAHDPFWEQDHDLLALYGLPATREEVQALVRPERG